MSVAVALVGGVSAVAFFCMSIVCKPCAMWLAMFHLLICIPHSHADFTERLALVSSLCVSLY